MLYLAVDPAPYISSVGDSLIIHLRVHCATKWVLVIPFKFHFDKLLAITLGREIFSRFLAKSHKRSPVYGNAKVRCLRCMHNSYL